VQSIKLDANYYTDCETVRTLIFVALRVVREGCPPETERFVLDAIGKSLPNRMSPPNSWNELTLHELRKAHTAIRERNGLPAAEHLVATH